MKFNSHFLLFATKMLHHPCLCLAGGRSEADAIEEITSAISGD